MRSILAAVFGCFVFFQGVSQINSDSLRSVWNNHSLPDTVRLRAIDDLIWFGYIQSNPDSAIYLTQHEYQLALRTNHLKFVASALNMLSNAWSVKGEPVKAKEYMTKRLDIESRLGNVGGMISAYTNLGNIAIQQNNKETALTCFFKSLHLCDSINDKVRYAVACDNLVTIYINEKDFPNSLKYINKSLDLKKELDDSLGMAVSYSHLGSYYSNTGNFGDAEKNLFLATGIFERRGQDFAAASCYSSLSVLYVNGKKYEKAMPYQVKALEINRRLNNRINETIALNELGYIYYAMKKDDQAVPYLKEAIDMGSEYKVWGARAAAAEVLSDIYKRKNDPKKALYYYRIFRDARDSTKAEEVRDIAYREQLKYEYGKKGLIEKTENEKKLFILREEARAEKTRRNIWYFVFASLLLLSGTIAVFIYKYSRQKNVIINQEHNLLRQKFLVSQMNPHFIFNSLSVVQHYLYKNNAMQAGIYLSKFSDLIRRILDFSRKEYISIEAESELLENYLLVQQMRFGDKFDYHIDIDERLMPAAVFIPPMLAQPFVENAIEHGIYYKEGKGNICIRLSYQSDTTVMYEIEDDGIGIEAAQLLKEKMEKRHDSLATAITRERMTSYRRENNMTEISITDKRTLGTDKSGVLVKLIIPCRNS